ncbi:hypothetical protein ACTAZI_11135 [Legionella bozemanae]|uniref:hypothetical protein n=1 Tax=Legionella bozemanae TaxID=447 RepID=UPI00399D0DFE
MLERREKLYNQIADAFDPKKKNNRGERMKLEERMELLLSALFELNETIKEEFNEAYKKEVDKAIKEASGEASTLDEEEKVAILIKKKTEALRNKEKQVTEKLNHIR